MSSTKKKTKPTAKKKAKSTAKKLTRRIAKKAAKSPAKKKATRAIAKKTKRPVRRKAATPVNEKLKMAAPVPVIPEAIKPNEELHPFPAEAEMIPDRHEEIKKLEHQFEHREDTVMHQENQKVKSAMTNRQKRVFRPTHRHS